ncbi:hypothetical protein PAHAL_2G139300 [Panicum hallii]|nr:hypothetical protein PAHAL_2G139300 [Panicum hallii]
MMHMKVFGRGRSPNRGRRRRSPAIGGESRFQHPASRAPMTPRRAEWTSMGAHLLRCKTTGRSPPRSLPLLSVSPASSPANFVVGALVAIVACPL